MLAHASQVFLKEGMMDSSDAFIRYVDKEGTLVTGNKDQNIYKISN